MDQKVMFVNRYDENHGMDGIIGVVYSEEQRALKNKADDSGYKGTIEVVPKEDFDHLKTLLRNTLSHSKCYCEGCRHIALKYYQIKRVNDGPTNQG